MMNVECHCKVGKESESVIHLRHCFSSKTRPPKPKMVPVGGASRSFLKLIISTTGSVLIFSKSKSAMTMMTTNALQHKHYE